MKFSEKKKKKYRQRRINRYCSNMIGCKFSIDSKHWDKVKDQAKINNNMYLLIQNQDGEYAIYKMIGSYGMYVKISTNKILQNQKEFSNHDYWKYHSTIEFAENGKIKSVKYGSCLGPYNANLKETAYVRFFVEE